MICLGDFPEVLGDEHSNSLSSFATNDALGVDRTSHIAVMGP